MDYLGIKNSNESPLEMRCGMGNPTFYEGEHVVKLFAIGGVGVIFSQCL